ncbi:S24 family peptidase [Enterococcus pernyi]|uniref:S24 family peptidase n=1 Tax=Enterococcus pernyi TaxID=590158 RepID=UPI000789BA40|nr:S24 family peptidase [Enterococcus pernyi]
MSALGNKEVMAKNIQYYMDRNGVDRRKLSSDLGISYTTLTDWIKAKTYPRIDKIEILANYFSITKADLVEERKLSTMLSSVIEITAKLDESRQKKVYECAEEQLEEQSAEQTKPAQQSTQITDIQSYKDEKKRAAESYGAVSAGAGEFLFGVERAETVYLPESDFPDEPFDYVLKINGDSMLPTYKDGEYIFVKSFSNGGNIRNGMLAIVMYDNEVYFKKLYFDDSGIRLVSLNKEYKDIVITDPSCFQVLGKVIA